MTDARYRRNAGCIFSLNYHLVWCPKYRMPVLTGQVATDLKRLLKQKAAELQVEIKSLEVRPDHVHLIVSADPTDAPQRLANQLKGFTSHWLRQRYAHLRSRLPTLWSRSYYVGSVGQVSEASVQRFIRMQKGRA